MVKLLRYRGTSLTTLTVTPPPLPSGNATLPDMEVEITSIFQAAADGLIDPPGNKAFDLGVEACVVRRGRGHTWCRAEG